MVHKKLPIKNFNNKNQQSYGKLLNKDTSIWQEFIKINMYIKCYNQGRSKI